MLNGRIVQIDYPNRVVRFYSQPLFSKSSQHTETSVLSFRYLITSCLMMCS